MVNRSHSGPERQIERTEFNAGEVRNVNWRNVMKALVVLVLFVGLFMAVALAVKHLVIAGLLTLVVFIFLGLLSSAAE